MHKKGAIEAEGPPPLAQTHGLVAGLPGEPGGLKNVSLGGQAAASRSTGSLLPENPAILHLWPNCKRRRPNASTCEQEFDLTADLAAYEQRVKEAPKIERELNALTRNYRRRRQQAQRDQGQAGGIGAGRVAGERMPGRAFCVDQIRAGARLADQAQSDRGC